MAAYQRSNVILKAENISLTLGGNPILKDLDVEIKDVTQPGQTTGQIVGFLGPSGVGKTKFFEILAGLLEPTTGQVLLGTPLKPVGVGMVGVVQQNYPLFGHRTVASNLMVAARKLYKTEAEAKERMAYLLERFKLTDKQNLYPIQLSGGQRQRIAIAQQLLSSEHFLLLDEPFSGLDVNMIDEVSELICEIAHLNEVNTVIVISHDIDATAAVADTLWLMGRDRDANDQVIPGARIKHSYDLIDIGLYNQPDIIDKPAFRALVKEIRDLFHTL
jgi:polar amino acid transport system ATP-binding protein/sulfate transport system ATP-binding protein